MTDILKKTDNKTQENDQNKQKKEKKKPRAIGRWYIGETLGKGGYSWVKKGYDKKTTKCVALKFMAKADTSWQEEQTKQVITEIESLKQIRHNNVLKLYAYNLNAKYPTKEESKLDCILLVLEYAPGGELFDILYYTSALESTIARTYFRQFICGLEACHSAGVAHRDLKPQNLLLDSRFNLKICDFGLSKVFESDNDTVMKTSYVGTRGYQAPELLLNRSYDLGCDVFSAGVVLFILLTGYPPFEEARKSDRWYRPIAKKNYKKFWDQHQGCQISDDDKAKDLIQKMLTYDPKNRITISEIKKHQWFNGKYLEGKDLIRILRNRHRAMENKRRKDAKKLKDLQHSIKRPLDWRTDDCLEFPEDCVEGIYDIYTISDFKEVYDTIYDLVGTLNGQANMDWETMVLTCTLKLQNTNRRSDSLIKFETIVYKSREFKNIQNNDNDDIIHVVRFNRVQGDSLDWKKVLREVIYVKCGGVLTGLPKWARQHIKSNQTQDDDEFEEQDEYDDLLLKEGFDVRNELVVN